MLARPLLGTDFNADGSDVAALILQLTRPGERHIDRDLLRTEWRRAASDLGTRRSPTRGNRGSQASQQLADALRGLARIGAVRRTDDGTVEILDRDLVQRAADLWAED